MKISLIISFYKNIPALEVILLSLERQSVQPFEVIISEDDYNPATFDFLKRIKANTTLNIKHLFLEEKKGWQKSQMLNKSVQNTTGEFLIFIDGDCVPHRHFIKGYADAIRENTVLLASRVMVSETLTDRIYIEKNLKLLSLWSLWRSGSTLLRNAFYIPWIKKRKKRGILGSNWGVHKKYLMEINGFDEDYVTMAEDVDVEWRLLKLGLNLMSIRFAAIQYHLYHPINLNYSKKDTEVASALYLKKRKADLAGCINGIKKTNLSHELSSQ